MKTKSDLPLGLYIFCYIFHKILNIFKAIKTKFWIGGGDHFLYLKTLLLAEKK